MPAGNLSPRPLGSSGMDVSALSLGSWRTFERLPPETGVAILRAARDEGINFFDDARYNDETGRAPIPTGYSEVLFGSCSAGRPCGATRRSWRTSCGGSSGPGRALLRSWTLPCSAWASTTLT